MDINLLVQNCRKRILHNYLKLLNRKNIFLETYQVQKIELELSCIITGIDIVDDKYKYRMEREIHSINVIDNQKINVNDDDISLSDFLSIIVNILIEEENIKLNKKYKVQIDL